MNVRDWRFWATTLVGILLVGAIGKFMGRKHAEDVNARSDPATSNSSSGLAAPKTVVSVTSQDSGGVTPDQLDMNFLRNLEEWTVERTRVNVRKAQAANGLPDEVPELTSEAGYLEMSNRKLAVIRVNVESGVRMVKVVGIVGDKLKSVGCVQESQDKVPITFGECADKISEVFGVTPTG